MPWTPKHILPNGTTKLDWVAWGNKKSKNHNNHMEDNLARTTKKLGLVSKFVNMIRFFVDNLYRSA